MKPAVVSLTLTGTLIGTLVCAFFGGVAESNVVVLTKRNGRAVAIDIARGGDKHFFPEMACDVQDSFGGVGIGLERPGGVIHGRLRAGGRRQMVNRIGACHQHV